MSHRFKKRKILPPQKPSSPLRCVDDDVWQLLFFLLPFEDRLSLKLTCLFLRDLFWRKLLTLGLKQETIGSKILNKKTKPNTIHSLRWVVNKSHGLKQIPRALPSLTRLELPNSSLKADDVRYLSSLTRLTELTINKSILSLSTLDSLSRLTTLQVLHLEQTNVEVTTKVSDRIRGRIPATFSFPLFLTKLNLSKSNLGIESHPTFDLPTLLSLDLSFSLSILDALTNIKLLNSLTELNLFGCCLTDRKISQISHLSFLTRLCLGSFHKDQTEEITDKSIETIKEMNHIQILGLRNTKVTDHGISQLSNSLSNLRILDVQGCPITNRSIKSILDFSYLSHLEIGNEKLSDSGYRDLLQSTSLVYLGSCHGLEVPSLALFTNIRALSLDCTWTVGNALSFIAGLSKLKELSLRDCDWVTSQSLSCLSGMTGLKKLYVGDRWRSGDLFIASLPNLEIINEPHRLTITTC